MLQLLAMWSFISRSQSVCSAVKAVARCALWRNIHVWNRRSTSSANGLSSASSPSANRTSDTRSVNCRLRSAPFTCPACTRAYAPHSRSVVSISGGRLRCSCNSSIISNVSARR